MNSRVIVSLSGGLDSSVLAYKFVAELGKENVLAITFDYNQKNSIEISKAKKTADSLDIKHIVEELHILGRIAKTNCSLIKNSNLKISTVQESLGHPQTVEYVPYRNMILCSILFAYCEKFDFNSVAMAFSSVDEYGFWDCTPPFVLALNSATNFNRKHSINLLTPFINLTKSEVVKLGKDLQVPFQDTYTCYEGTEPACGICSACSMRRKAFKDNILEDPIEYAKISRI